MGKTEESKFFKHSTIPKNIPHEIKRASCVAETFEIEFDDTDIDYKGWNFHKKIKRN